MHPPDRLRTLAAAVAALVTAIASVALVFSLTGSGTPPRADLVAVAPSETSTTGPAATIPTTPTTAPDGPASSAPDPSVPATGPSTPPSGAAPSPTAPTAGPAGPPPGAVLTSGPVEPVRLAIPAIGVDAPIVPVGLEPDGSMEVPAVDRAGWYHPTAVWPGMPAGSSVLAAHVDYGGRRGVFFDLRRVPVGAEVWVLDGQGRARRFVVDTRFQIDKDALASHDLFRVDGSPTLTLITCGGAFDSRSRHYQDNIVVQASPA